MFKKLLYISNNSIKHQSFVCTQLNVKTVLFLAVQFSMLFVCTRFKCQTVLLDPQIGPYQVLLLLLRVNLGVMAMKGTPNFRKLLPYWNLTIWWFNKYAGHSLRVRVLTLCRDAVCLFYSHRTLVRGGGSLTFLQRSSRYILQPQPTGLINLWLVWFRLVWFYGTPTIVGY